VREKIFFEERWMDVMEVLFAWR